MDSSRQAIRASFVSKFSSIQELPKKLPGKAKAKNAYAPEDVAEVKQLVLEGQDPDTRRNALLGLFKLSLRDGLEELLIEEGASVVCQLASTAEAKGSGARRAAVQALRNMAAHPGNREALVGVAEEMAVVIEEEQPGSGPREAALETLEKLSQNEKCLEEMADMAGLLPALVNATKSEAQGAVGRESALTVMQRLQAAQVRPRANTQEQTEDQVSGLVDTCLDSVAKEPKGSGAKMVAIKTLRDVAKGPFRGLLMAKPGLLDQILGAARTESPGSETRSAAFDVIADLSEYPENRTALMKTNKLAETVIQAVRDEPPTSSAREAAMYTVARLCMHPDNRPFFMKGPAEGLVGVCIRAAQQELVGSGGRAAALEALAGLALAPENQASLLAAPGVLAMAVEGAGDANRRVKEAGLDLIAALALLPANRAPLFAFPGLVALLVQALSVERLGSPTLAASLDAIRCFLEDAKIQKQLASGPLMEQIWRCTAEAEPNERASVAGLGALVAQSRAAEHGFTQAHCTAVVQALRDANAGSEARALAFALALRAVQSGGCEFLVAAGGLQECLARVAVLRQASPAAVPGPGLAANEFQRMSLKKTLVSGKSVRGINLAPFSPEAAVVDVKLALGLLLAMAARGVPLPPAAFDALLALGLDKGPDPESTVVLCTHALEGSEDRAGRMVKEGAGPALVTAASMGARPAEACAALARLCAFDVAAANLKEPEVRDLLRFLASSCGGASDDAALLLPGLSAVLHLLFHGPHATLAQTVDCRAELERGLARLAGKGAEEDALAAAGRVAQGVLLALRVLGGARTPPPGSASKTLQKRVVAIAAHSDPGAAAAALEQVAGWVQKTKGWSCAVEDAPLVASVAAKKRRAAVDSAASAVGGESDVVVFCAGPGAAADPVFRLYMHMAVARKVPFVVVGKGPLRGWLEVQARAAKQRADAVEGLGPVGSF